MYGYISREQVKSWWDRLTFLKNETQAELDIMLEPDEALTELNAKLQEAKHAVQKIAEKKDIHLY